MSIINNGGPAFPTTDFTHAGQVIPGSEGMTLRDYFAAKAMQPMVNEYDDFNLMARTAYDMADAMLKAREAK